MRFIGNPYKRGLTCRLFLKRYSKDIPFNFDVQEFSKSLRVGVFTSCFSTLVLDSLTSLLNGKESSLFLQICCLPLWSQSRNQMSLLTLVFKKSISKGQNKQALVIIVIPWNCIALPLAPACIIKCFCFCVLDGERPYFQ